jgi:hypothetical protein
MKIQECSALKTKHQELEAIIDEQSIMIAEKGKELKATKEES